MWDVIDAAIDQKGTDFFAVSWIRGHLETANAQNIEEAGGFAARDIYGNNEADALADTGVTKHDMDQRRSDAAEDRIVLAMLAQRMAVAVWEAIAEADEEVGRAIGFKGTEGDVPGEEPDAEVELEGPNQEDQLEYNGHDDNGQGLPYPGWLMGDTAAVNYDNQEKEEDEDPFGWGGDLDAHEHSHTNEVAEGSRREHRPAKARRTNLHSNAGTPANSNGGRYSCVDIGSSQNGDAINKVIDGVTVRQRYPDYAWVPPSGGRVQKVVFEDVDSGALKAYRKTITFAPELAEPIHWWINLLEWKDYTGDGNDGTARCSGTSFLEMVVDFQMTANVKITSREGADVCWAKKAVILHGILRTMSRTHAIKLNGKEVNLKQALGTGGPVQALVALGGTEAAGVKKRPKWASPNTAETIAENVVAAVKRARTASRWRSPTGRVVRTFAAEWKLILPPYKGNGWTPKALLDIQKQTGKTTTSSTKAMKVDNEALENVSPQRDANDDNRCLQHDKQRDVKGPDGGMQIEIPKPKKRRAGDTKSRSSTEVTDDYWSNVLGKPEENVKHVRKHKYTDLTQEQSESPKQENNPRI